MADPSPANAPAKDCHDEENITVWGTVLGGKAFKEKAQ